MRIEKVKESGNVKRGKGMKRARILEKWCWHMRGRKGRRKYGVFGEKMDEERRKR